MRTSAPTTPEFLRGFRWICCSICSAGWVAIAASGCSNVAPDTQKLPPPEVVVSRPVRRAITDFVEYTGRTAAVDSVEIRARVSGYLTQVNFEAGEEVDKGKLLFQIDERPFQAAVAAAEAEVSRWDASIKKYRDDVARRKELREKNIIPQEELDQAVAELAVSEASKLGALADVDKAKLDLEYTHIAAPVTGRVSRAQITEGNLVVPGDAPGSLLTTLVSMDPVYVYFDIDEQTLLDYLKRARDAHKPQERGAIKSLNIPVSVSLANETDFPHQGILAYVDNQVNLSTGTLQARAVLENPDRYLKIGLYVRVRLPLGDPYSGIVVPETAIGTDQGRKFVLVVGDQNIVESRTVMLGRRQPDGTRVVTDGLNGDEKIVIDGLLRARPGKPVTPVESATTSASAPTPEASSKERVSEAEEPKKPD